MVNEAAREFGDALRCERERRGITLEMVADATKISATVMSGLERGDLSRWPTGLFRRAFVRAYAEAVGLPVEDIVDAFLAAHGGEGQAPRASAAPRRAERALVTAPQGLRLHLAGEPAQSLASWATRLAAAAIDVALPCLAGGGVALAGGWPVMGGIGVAALASLVLSSAGLRRTPGQELVRRAQRGSAGQGAGVTALAIPALAPAEPAPAQASALVEAEPRRAPEPARPGARLRRPSRERARAQRASRHA